MSAQSVMVHSGWVTDAEVRPVTGPLTSTWRPDHPVDIRRTLGPLRRGSLDPTFRVDGAGLWRTSLTPVGPATLLLATASSPGVTATAWGPGAEWLLAQVPEMLGAGDDWSELDCTGQPLLQRTMRAAPGLRIPRTGLVFESLVPAVLAQRVVGADARRSWYP